MVLLILQLLAHFGLMAQIGVIRHALLPHNSVQLTPVYFGRLVWTLLKLPVVLLPSAFLRLEPDPYFRNLMLRVSPISLHSA